MTPDLHTTGDPNTTGDPYTAGDPPTTTVTLPVDLLKLEGHFDKKCPVHNDDRKFRSELNRLKKYLADCRINEGGDRITLANDGRQEEVEVTVEKGNDIRADQSRYVLCQCMLYDFLCTKMVY